MEQEKARIGGISPEGFVPRERLDEANARIKTLEKEAAESAAEMARLRERAGDDATMIVRIKRLEREKERMEKEHGARLENERRKTFVDMTFLKAGAKNITAARALLGVFDESDEGNLDFTSWLECEIERLKTGPDTAFLFETEPKTPVFKGISPAESMDAATDPFLDGFESRLSEARRRGDNLLAIQIKQEAALEGFHLI